MGSIRSSFVSLSPRFANWLHAFLLCYFAFLTTPMQHGGRVYASFLPGFAVAGMIAYSYSLFQAFFFGGRPKYWSAPHGLRFYSCPSCLIAMNLQFYVC